MEDVNMGEPSPDTSSVPEGNGQVPQPPAEAIKTAQEEWQPDKNAKFVPYDRFHEVVQKRNELTEKYKAFDGKDELLKTYENFDQILTQNPELFNAIMSLLQGQNGQQQQGQQQQELDTTQKLAMDNYVGKFTNFCADNKIDKDIQPYVYQIAESFLLKLNPDPLRNYDMRSLNLALDHTKKFLASISKANLANYVQTKSRDNNVPTSASQGGSPPVAAPKPLGSQQERAAAWAEKMRAGQY